MNSPQSGGDEPRVEGPVVAPTQALDLGEVQNEAMPPKIPVAPEDRPPEPTTGSGGGASRARIVGFDVARFLAFVGMIFVNYRVVLDTSFSAAGPAWLETFLGFFPGRAAALFVLLAGVGVTLMAGGERAAEGFAAIRKRPALSWLRHLVFLLFLGACGLTVGFQIFQTIPEGRMVESEDIEKQIDVYLTFLENGGMRSFVIGLGAVLGALALAFVVLGKRLGHPRVVLAKRALFLFGIGYAWYPLWTGDILHFYGVFLLVGALVVGLRALWIYGLMLAALAGAFYWQYENDFLADWVLYLLEYKDEWQLDSILRSLFFNGWHPVFPWVAFFLVGLLIGRIDASRWKSLGILLLIGAALVAFARLASPIVEEALQGEEETITSEVFPIEVLDEAVAAAAAKPLLDEEGKGRVARARIPLTIDPEIDRELHEKSVVDARRLRTMLREDREGGPYPEIRLALQMNEDGAPRLNMQLAHDSEKALPEDREQLLRRTVHRISSWMTGRDIGLWAGMETGTLSFSSAWPGGLEEVVLERRVPRKTESGEIEMVIDRRVAIQRARAKDMDTWPQRVRRQCGLSCWPSPGLFYFLDATGIALLVIGACLGLGHVRLLRRLLQPLASAGRMALTLYLAHILVGLAIIDWMDMMDGANLQFITAASLACALVGATFAVAWSAFFKLGPLESVMRWLTR